MYREYANGTHRHNNGIRLGRGAWDTRDLFDGGNPNSGYHKACAQQAEWRWLACRAVSDGVANDFMDRLNAVGPKLTWKQVTTVLRLATHTARLVPGASLVDLVRESGLGDLA